MGGAEAASGLSIWTPWYPQPYNRMAGAFVADHARLASGMIAGGVRVVHALEWPGGTEQAAAALRPPFDAVLDRLRTDDGTHLTGAFGRVDRVPVFTVGGAEWADRAEAAVRDTARVLGPVEAPIAHGHVGYLGGVLAARLADPATKVFATEHSSALADVLAQPRAAELYREVLERAERLFCVSEAVRAPIVERFGELAAKTEVLHNPIDFSGAPRRAARPESLDKWLFVGGLREIKGVPRMLEAFIAAAGKRPELTLTVYGSGPLQQQVEDRLSEAGLRERVELKGAVPHAQLLAELPRYDLLVAPSLKETFHIAVPEAVAAGLPVIVTRSGGPQESLAGVEDKVGVFIDVADSPDEVVDAWLHLQQNLDTLDLDGAREALDARYGWNAIATRLAQAYGVEPVAAESVSPDSAGRATATGNEPVAQRVVVPATSGWRAYHVEAEFEALRRLNVPTVVLTDNDQMRSAAGTLPTMPVSVSLPPASAGKGAASGHGSGGAAKPGLAKQGRRVAGLLKRRVADVVSNATQPAAPAASSAPATAVASWPPFDLSGATLVLTDCQSMPLAHRLLSENPGLRVVVELDRRGALSPAVDSPEDASDLSRE